MARVVTWQSSEWARWLVWTVLYALGVLGGFDHGLRSAESDARLVVMGLVAAVVAFGVGVRVRSWGWGLGPAALVLYVAAITTWLAMDDFAQRWLGLLLVS